MDASVLASDPTLGVLKVWTVVANYTLGYGRVSDALTHGRIASEAGVTRETVRRAVKWLAQAGIITYTAGFGDPQQGRNSFSRIAVILPEGTPPASGDPSDESDGDPSREWGETSPVSGDTPLQPEGTTPLPRVGTDPSGERGNRERTTDEDVHRKRTPEEDNRGVAGFVGQVQFAREEEPPAPETDLRAPSQALVLASLVEANEEEQPEPQPAWDRDPSTLSDWLEQVWSSEPIAEPEPAERRVGTATGEQAAQRFEAETGLPLSKRTRETLARSLDEVAGTVTPNELLCALGYWYEKRQGRWPEDASERVMEAMAYAHGCLIDPVNAMTPAGASQEGRCRAKMALLPRQEREAAEADPGFRLKGFGLDWPAPRSPLGLLPEPRPGEDEIDPFAIPLAEWRRALAPAGRPG